MTTDPQLTAMQAWLDAHPPAPYVWDGAPEGPMPDEFVSESEAAHRQRAVDDWLTRDAS